MFFRDQQYCSSMIDSIGLFNSAEWTLGGKNAGDSQARSVDTFRTGVGITSSVVNAAFAGVVRQNGIQ